MSTGVILRIAAIGEIATGLMMVAVPGAIGWLLLGEDLAGTGLVLGRAFGIAIIGLGVACWPGPPRLGMAAYSAGIALYLGAMGVLGAAAGALLWPVVALHAALAGLMLLRPAR